MAKPKLFRPHRHLLEESMARTREMESKDDLVAIVREQFEGLLDPNKINSDTIIVEYYAEDDRIGWSTYIVTLNDVGVVGFTNHPLD